MTMRRLDLLRGNKGDSEGYEGYEGFPKSFPNDHLAILTLRNNPSYPSYPSDYSNFL